MEGGGGEGDPREWMEQVRAYGVYGTYPTPFRFTGSTGTPTHPHVRG